MSAITVNEFVDYDTLFQRLKSVGFTRGMTKKIIDSTDDHIFKRLLSFLKNELKITNFTIFASSVSIQPVKRFNVGDFFLENKQGKIKICVNEHFKWILNQIKDLELSLEHPIDLDKSLIIKDAFDSDLQSDFCRNSAIQLLTFIPLIKGLIEAYENKEYGLDNSNIFFVDLSEIDPNIGTIAVNVGFSGDKFCINGFPVDDNELWEVDSYFFSESPKIRRS